MDRTCILLLPAFFSIVAYGQTDASTMPETQPTTIQELEPAQLSALMASASVTIYDCNEPDMHAEAHVPGAVPMVYDEVTADRLPPDRNAAIVFYCYSPECPAAAAAARTAIKLGFTNVYCMSAGIIGWQDAGLPTEP